ncbi:MAG TPA: CpsD/CapB family tyrosine-protein kinase [Vicinamibacterales bacterium]|nr:CpsD/CapB family tyrosine-protein kinase [Vicinamibacterales bacterium]
MQKAQFAHPFPLSDVSDPVVVEPPLPAKTTGPRRSRREPVDPTRQDYVSNAYCRLAAQLHQIQQSRRLTTVMVASALAGEGKSLTAANLARALSEAYGKRVVLIDADLRRPSQHALFGIRNTPGLIDCLAGNLPVRPARLSNTLHVVPAGSPEANPLERLSSSGLRELLSEQAERSDWVIIDVPPLAACPDAGILAHLVDGVVVVVRAGQTPLASVESAVTALGRERVVGVVLNRSTSRDLQYGYPARKA